MSVRTADSFPEYEPEASASGRSSVAQGYRRAADVRPNAWLWRSVVVAAILWAAATRLIALPTIPPGLHFDEAVYGLMAKDIVAGARPVFFPAFTGREPLYMYAMAVLFTGIGASTWTIRLTSAFAGIATVALVYALGRAWFDRRVGAVAAWLIAVSAWHLTVSRNGYPNILIPPIEAASAVCLWRAWRTGRARDAAVGGGLVGLVLYTYLAARFWPICVAAWLVAAVLVAPRQVVARWRAIATAAASACAVFAPLGVYFVRHPADFWERANQVLASRSLSGEALLRTYAANAWRSIQGLVVPGLGDPRWHYNLPGRPMLGAGAAALLIVGVVIAARRWRDVRHLWLLLWLVVMSAPGILTLEMQPAGQRMFGITPALSLLCALGACGLWHGATSIGRRVATRGDDPGLRVRIATTAGLLAAAATVLIVAREAFAAVAQYRAWAAEPATAQVFNADYAAMARLAAHDVAAGRTVVVLSQHYRHPTVAFLAPDAFDQLVWTDPERALPVPVPRGADPDTLVYLRPRSYAHDDLPAVVWLEILTEQMAIERTTFAGDGTRDPVVVDGPPWRPTGGEPAHGEQDRPPTSDVVRYVVPRQAGTWFGTGRTPTVDDDVRFGNEVFITNGQQGDRSDVPRNRPLEVVIDAEVVAPPADAPGRQLVVRLVAPLEDLSTADLAPHKERSAADLATGETVWSQHNRLGYLVPEWRTGDRFKTWTALPIDRAIPALTTYEVRVSVVDDAMRPLSYPLRLPDGSQPTATELVLSTVRFAVEGRIRATDAELASAANAWPDADGGRFVLLTAALDRVIAERTDVDPADVDAEDVDRAAPAVLEIAWARRWPPAGADGAKPPAPRDRGAIEIIVAPEGPAAIGPLVVAGGVVDAGAPDTPMRDKEIVRRRYAVSFPAGWPVGPSSVYVRVGDGAMWRAGSLDVR